MSIESLTVNPQAAPVAVSNGAGSNRSIVQVEAVEKPVIKMAPSAPKVDIDREPIISSQELESKIAQLNEALSSRNQAVVFSTDPSTGKDVVMVSNKSTGELIRQMPSVEALKAMQNIDTMIGLIFSTQT